MFKPEGVYVAMLTPFTEDGFINEAEMRRITDFLCESGVHGLFPVSTVGEYIHMTQEEKVRLMNIVVDQSRGRINVTPGVGRTHPADSIFLAKKAKEIGCDGVVVAPPYYNPLSQEMIEKYYETISDSIDLPIILYNIPLFSPPLSYDVVMRLSRRKNIVGMKDSSGSMVDFLHFMDQVRLVGEDTHFLTGREETLLPCLMMGGKGCMTATYGILPEIMMGIYEEWKKWNYAQAKELQYSVLLLIRDMFELPVPLGFKIALETRGFKMGPPKQPLSDAEQYKVKTVKTRIEKIMHSFLRKFPRNQ